MADRGSGLVTALIVVVVLCAGTLCFMFATWIEKDEIEQNIKILEKRDEDLAVKKRRRQEDLEKLTRDREERRTQKQTKAEMLEEVKGWLANDKRQSDQEAARFQPAMSRLVMTINDRYNEVANVDRQMDESRDAFESDERSLLEALRLANDRLMNTIRRFKEEEKIVDDEISDIKAKLDEVRKRLKIVQAEAMRSRVVSDAGGSIVRVGAEVTNFCVVSLGYADRLRKGLRFQIWAPKRGFGLGWVQETGSDFVKDNILPGDWLVVGRGVDQERYAIMNVGINRQAEEDGTGIARQPGNNTHTVLGPGVTSSFSLVGQEWYIERATESTMPAEDWGVIIKGMVEIVDVRAHSSDAVILPERIRKPSCPQCGWEAPKSDMKYCPYCTVGDADDEIQTLDEPTVALLNKAVNPFLPMMAGDRLSNPYFAPNRPLVFCLGSVPVRRSRQMLKTFLKANNGRVVEPEVLLTKPQDAAVSVDITEVYPYEINYLIPGIGADADDLINRARSLGIRIMREGELFEFFGEIR